MMILPQLPSEPQSYLKMPESIRMVAPRDADLGKGSVMPTHAS